MPSAVPLLLLLLAAVAPSVTPYDGLPYSEGGTPCYDQNGKPKRCIPEFGNAAYGLEVESTNTCGEEEDTMYCIQTGAKIFESCGRCRAGDHPPYYLTDLNNPRNETWWQSETMLQDIQYPNVVNLTLHLKKAHDITYVRVWFHSPRPESFAIYKRTREDGPWVPYQFYSGACYEVYGLEDRNSALGGEETEALCTSEFSDISPLTGGNIAFSTLEGRTTAYSFDNSSKLQEWVTATDIKIVLNRINTFGDELFQDSKVLMSYFYAITDIAVGARCKCNGHASECVSVPVNTEGDTRKMCRCEHNTAGPDCNECAPFYQDAPWGRASISDVHECKPCNCNGFSNRCFFDDELYRKTGHGGHCLDCTGNRDGPNCERCRDNYYQHSDGFCIPCNCNEKGSRSLQCTDEGKCICKPGVTGDKCERCSDDFYDFSSNGCKECKCLAAGSLYNQPKCDQLTGYCDCKENVEGKECKRCKLGYFNLDDSNEFGCTPCFCYGHSSECGAASGYSKVVIESIFARSSEKWAGHDLYGRSVSLSYNALTQSVGLSSSGKEPIYFVAPDRFLGDQRASYNQDLEFKLRIGENNPAPAVEDIMLEGAGLRVSQSIFGQGNNVPAVETKVYKFRLHENPDYGWKPQLSAKDFMSVLANLTAIKIRGTYTAKGVGFLDDVRLSTARRGAVGPPARWIEMCSCPDGYVGQFCESCAPGFRHEPPSGGPFSPCVPCNCNGHADICDAETGRCICQHNTAGDNCEMCARGYYGDAIVGTPNDCEVCPCPQQGACMLVGDDTVCLECPKGYAGARCDLCSDGYYGDVKGLTGPPRRCQLCDCNMNVDLNAVGNCNRTTGECLKCIYNTAGPQCDQCLPGYFGDALAHPQGDCKPCHCNPAGTEETGFGPLVCNQRTGQCSCRPFVTGTNCDQCLPGYYNIQSGKGCEACNCDPIGAVNATCDVSTGQCYCRPGVIGQNCDVCEAHHYGFSTDGCIECNCDQIGSEDLQCDPTGQCPCRVNVEGMRCDRCKENKYDRQRGCVNCPACYSLIQDAVQNHRQDLEKLEDLLEDLIASPTVLGNEDFDNKLKQVQERVQQLSYEALRVAGGDDSDLTMKLDELKSNLDDYMKTLDKINAGLDETDLLWQYASRNASDIENTIEKAKLDLQDAQDYILGDGAAALKKARNRSAEFGQQNQQMTDIAHQARITVQKQLKDAEETRKIAELAVNISTDAFRLSKEAREKQMNASEELLALEMEFQRTKDKLEQTSSLAAATHEHTSAAYNESLSLYTRLHALPSPEIDADNVKTSAKQCSEEGDRLLKEAQRLRDTYNDEVKQIGGEIRNSEDLLENARELQQRADELLADADVAKRKAADAVELGDKTLKDAQDTLITLEDFDKQIQDSKQRAMKSLQTIPEIKESLMEANDKTTNAEEALVGAEHNAQQASNTAQSAQNQFAQQASQEADKIRQSADETKQQATDLRDEVHSLATRIHENELKLADMKSQAESDQALTREAKGKVGQASTNANTAARKVAEAMKDVEKIQKDLNDLTDIDEETLNQLEEKLQQAIENFKKADLDKEVSLLRDAKIEQSFLVNTYKEELVRLRADVENIQLINEALPEGCWKRLRLEP